ncbi:hypothetical protein ND920_03320 [Vibrio ordalii]|uniref:hypothetical protein n=1 Tax=Vibrio ordalii TaxID=28174 RepID=UPI002578C99D|nr:hypothetical protein [Vibrio ordalii]MCS0350647.1 hypothetical protein [Vibrio ordalii]
MKYVFLFIALISIIGILILNYLLLIDKEPLIQSAFGSMFGVSSALFSGLAFLGLIYTIFLQMKELSLQREELKLTRQELSKSAQAHQAALGYQQQQAMSLERAAIINSFSVRLDALKEEEKQCDFKMTHNPHLRNAFLDHKSIIQGKIADLTKELEAYIKQAL